MLKELTSIEQLQAFIQQEGKKLLFKHSTTCPVSAKAYSEFTQYIDKHPDLPAAFVKVIESRPISNEIASLFEIKHESPQIFLLEDDQVKWHTSHHRIRQETIDEQLS